MNIKYPIIVMSLLSSVSCAEMTALNQQIGDWAGQINQTIAMKNTSNSVSVKSFSDSIVSKRNIDTLYVKVKRAFDFKTRTEELQGIKGDINRKWAEAALGDRAYAHDVTPGVYYHLADSYTYGHLNITLEKIGNDVHINWTVKTDDKSIPPRIKDRILQVIK